MTDRARETYHHGDLRNALVQAGLDLTRRGGPEALVLRDLTRTAGVSPSAAYRHFPDRNGLVTAVAARIQDAMAQRMTAAERTPTPSGRERLRAVGLGYIRFAIHEPGWFQTAFTSIDAAPSDTPIPAPLSALVGALDALVAEGCLSPSDRAGAEWPCWSAVHGFALLALHGPLRRLGESERDAAAQRTVDAIIDGVLGEAEPRHPSRRSAQRTGGTASR